jgi:hypothetical protein
VIYKVLYTIEPASYFGLPEGAKTVIKAAPGRELVSAVLDTHSRNLVRYGTLSEYRAEAEAVALKRQIANGALEVWDNYFQISIEAIEPLAAKSKADATLSKFLRFLMAEQGDFFRATFLQLQDEAGRALQVAQPARLALVHATFYNLPELVTRIEKAAARAHLCDERLDKALLYYEHARFLFNARGYAAQDGVHDSLLITSAYLHLWKCIAVLLGDPGTDRDYQSRYKQFGLPKDYWRTTIQPLYEVRCEYDVAHHSLSADALGRVEAAFMRAAEVCREVIGAVSQMYLGQEQASQRSVG